MNVPTKQPRKRFPSDDNSAQKRRDRGLTSLNIWLVPNAEAAIEAICEAKGISKTQATEEALLLLAMALKLPIGR